MCIKLLESSHYSYRGNNGKTPRCDEEEGERGKEGCGGRLG